MTNESHIDYLSNVLETWTLRDLRDALGIQEVAELWGCSVTAATAAVGRGRTSVDRMRKLQDKVRTNEAHYRSALVTARYHGIRHNDSTR